MANTSSFYCVSNGTGKLAEGGNFINMKYLYALIYVEQQGDNTWRIVGQLLTGLLCLTNGDLNDKYV